jgi:uncharacterized protein (DUF885 family)
MFVKTNRRARRRTTESEHPDGATYYASRLAFHTTTDMSAAEIHAFGLSEVERIQAEMGAIMQRLGFGGDRKAFFSFLETDPRFYFPQTPKGKAAYIARSEEIIASMNTRLDDVFIRKP